MKIQKKSKRTKRILLTIIVLIILAGASYAAYLLLGRDDSSSDSQGISYDKPTKEQIDAGQDAKRQTIEEDQAAKDDPKLDPQGNDTSDTPSVQLTAASVEGDTLYIRTEIEGIYSEGSCTLTLTKNGVTVTKSAGVQPLPKSTTCKGFNIPTSELSKGTWTIDLNATVSGSTVHAKGSVEV